MATGFGNLSVSQDPYESKMFNINFTWREALDQEYFCVRVFADGEQVNSLYMYVGESDMPFAFYASNLVYGYTYGELRFEVVVGQNQYELYDYLDYGDLDGILMRESKVYVNFKIEEPGYLFGPYIESCIPSKTYCKVVIGGADPDYRRDDAYVTCVVYTSDFENKIEVEQKIGVLQSSVEVFIEGLSPNTTYYLRPTFHYTENGEEVSSGYIDTDDDDVQGYYVFKTRSPVVPFWSWENSNAIDGIVGDANTTQIRMAYKSITKVQGYGVSDFSHNVWNDLVSYVRWILEETNDTWSTYENETGKTYLDRYNTLMGNGEYTLTAEKFNALRFNIGSRASTGITDRKQGDVVYGNYFTTLTECMNRWISEKL